MRWYSLDRYLVRLGKFGLLLSSARCSVWCGVQFGMLFRVVLCSVSYDVQFGALFRLGLCSVWLGVLLLITVFNNWLHA